MVWACLTSDVDAVLLKLLPGPIADIGYHPYMLDSYPVNGRWHQACMGSAVSRYHDWSGPIAWSIVDRQTARYVLVSLETPRTKVSLRPLKIYTQLGRDPKSPNSNSSTTEGKIPKMKTDSSL